MKTNIFFSLCLCATVCCTQAQQDTLFYKKGVSEMNNNNYNKAISYFTMALEINQNEKALKDYTAEIALHPSDKANNSIGMLYERMKNYDKAIVYYAKVIKT